ncbi:MAG TPA: hypothetical protein VH229_06935 [Candidatus Udaeobacter sp.]|nr:hypothetical protein [Candidatus Udaeobacter sp.]
MRTHFRLLLVSVVAFASPLPCSHAATLDDLKKLEIICFVPSYLPEGFQLNKVDITYDEMEGDDHNPKQAVPLYAIEYGNDGKATFSIESAWEGIGDRNIMADEENAEETEITSPFGPMYLIYRPKGKDGRKDEIIANWVSDTNIDDEKSDAPLTQATLGRFHGFSATGITLADFGKIVQSLHPVRDDTGGASAAPSQKIPALKIHPKVFSMINCRISDSESPVVTEINLDAVEKNGNQFNDDDLKQDGEWLRSPMPDGNGFMRYRVLESKGDHYKIEYQENGGGSLTTASVVEFDVEKRDIGRDGKPVSLRVLRVTSFDQK